MSFTVAYRNHLEPEPDQRFLRSGFGDGHVEGVAHLLLQAVRHAALPLEGIVAVQGVLQALGFAFKPLVSAFLRLILFTFPVAFLFTLSSNVLSLVWWTFPIAEILDCFVSFVFLKQAQKQKIGPLDEKH